MGARADVITGTDQGVSATQSSLVTADNFQVATAKAQRMGLQWLQQLIGQQRPPTVATADGVSLPMNLSHSLTGSFVGWRILLLLVGDFVTPLPRGYACET